MTNCKFTSYNRHIHVLNIGKALIVIHPSYGKSGAAFKLSGEELSEIFETDNEFFIPKFPWAF